jgi:hypothetical protein
MRGYEWISLAQHEGEWQALMKTIVNIRVPLKLGNIE